ncbi:MAG TPA: c-type cytochrome, partial [Planctomycetaceae bacterium]|nr:c-type cytochrome [Planctomycetaceae bacterium]
MRWLTITTAVLVGALGLPHSQAAPPAHLNGQKIYEQKCVKCHGKDGRGNPEMDVAPLAGEQTLEGLTQAIAETMP